MNRRTITAYAAGVLTAALVGVGLTAAATPSDSCASLVNTSNNAVSGYENYRYLDCRVDRQDAALKRIEEKLNVATPSPSATPTATPSATPTPTVAPSPSVTPTPTVTPSATPSATSSSTPTPTVTPPTPGTASIGKGWEITADQVGLKPFGLKCADLPVYTIPRGNTVAAGTVISRQRINSWLDLSMGNITIKESCIQPASGYVGMGSTSLTTWNNNRPLQGPIVVQDSEYDGSLLTPKEQAYIGFFQGTASFYRNYVHKSGSGIGFQGTSEKTNANVVVQNNYVDDLIAYGDASGSGNHQSAFTVRDFGGSATRTMLVKDNFFDCDGANATAGFFVQPNGEDVSNVTAQGNLLAGNGCNLTLEDDQGRFPGVTYHNMRAIDNRFRPTEYGPARVAGSGEGWREWADNYRFDATKADGRGAVVPKP